MVQAVAAIRFANERGVKLNFHINATRIEGGASPVLKNLRALFEAHAPHALVEHPWLDREPFLKLVSEMDIGMAVSFSETFNITIADFVQMDIPIVASPEVFWVHPSYRANPNDSREITWRLHHVFEEITEENDRRRNLFRLLIYSEWSKKIWLHWMANGTAGPRSGILREQLFSYGD
jgi:hypothetical protein